MGRYCVKCGKQISENDEICTNCGYILGKTLSISPTRRKERKKSNLGLVSIIIVVAIVIGGACVNEYVLNNNQKVINEDIKSREMSMQIGDGEKSAGSDKEKVIENKMDNEKKDDAIEREEIIKFTTYEDKVFKFKIDYPETMQLPTSNEGRDKSSAIRYKTQISEVCVIFYGNLFQKINKTYDIKYWMKNDKSDYVSDGINNVMMHELSDTAYEYEYNKNGIRFVGRKYFGKVGKSEQSHYVELRYSSKAKDRDVAVAKKMYYSFKPGFDTNDK